MWVIGSNLTLTELLEHIRIATLVEDDNITDAQLTVIINQGIHEVAVAAQWPWLEASSTVSFVDSQQTYALPADFHRAQSMVDDDHDTTIPYIAPSQFFELYGNDTGNESDTPSYWTLWEDSIYFTPIPSDNDTDRCTLYYYKAATELAAGGDTPEWDEAFHWIIVEYGKWKVWEREEYFDQAERAFIAFARYIADMEAFYGSRVDRTPWIYGDGVARRRGDPNIPSLRTI